MNLPSLSSRYLWDTCVFHRLLSDFNPEESERLRGFVDKARAGQCQIFTSSITLAEFDHRAIDPAIGTITNFFEDFLGSVTLVDTLPDIMIHAGAIRSNEFVYSGPPKPGSQPKNRVMTVGDSVHLATALWLKQVSKIDDLVVHTFDEGKAKGVDGKAVPLLGLEDWTGKIKDREPIKSVLAIPRTKP